MGTPTRWSQAACYTPARSSAMEIPFERRTGKGRSLRIHEVRGRKHCGYPGDRGMIPRRSYLEEFSKRGNLKIRNHLRVDRAIERHDLLLSWRRRCSLDGSATNRGESVDGIRIRLRTVSSDGRRFFDSSGSELRTNATPKSGGGESRSRISRLLRFLVVYPTDGPTGGRAAVRSEQEGAVAASKERTFRRSSAEPLQFLLLLLLVRVPAPAATLGIEVNKLPY